MAWSDHKFSDQYGTARAKLADGAVADSFKDQKSALLRAITDSGFQSSANPAMEALRAQVRNPAMGEPSGTLQDSRLLRAVGHGGATTGAIDQGFVSSLKYPWYATFGTGRILAGGSRDNSFHRAL